MSALKPICVPCERFYRPKKNGYAFMEGMPLSNDPKIGRGKGASGWAPYKLWMGDLWECPTCGHQTIVETGAQPIAEHYQLGFNLALERFGNPTLLVKDC